MNSACDRQEPESVLFTVFEGEGEMRTLRICFLACLFITQVAVADYILSSGSNDTGTNGGQSIIRYTDAFETVWERSPAKGTAETQAFALEISPLNGDVYTSQIASPQLSKHLSYADGAFIGRAVPAGGQADGTGKYTAPGEALQDIQFGYDYNKDGVADLWVCRRDTFEVYDGTTLNRTGDTGMADLLTSLKIADGGGSSGVQDGTGGFGITFGPDISGDGVGDLFAAAGVNASTGSRINVWNPVTMTKVATYLADGTKDNCLIVLGPDVNGDGKQDLWVSDPRNHRIRAYDYATGAVVADSISLVRADAPSTAVTLRFPTDIDYGPDGDLLVTTRFATSLDPQWTGPSDTAGGNLLRIKWDAASRKGLVTLLFEYSKRLDSVAYIAPKRMCAVDPYPAPGATDVPRDAILGWTPAQTAEKHDVYFGTNSDDVEAASRSNPLGILVSQGQTASTFDPGELTFGQTYYWRIDEVNAAPDNTLFKCGVWSFTVEPALYPAENVVATASIPGVEGTTPQNTANRSGLNTSGQHSNVAPDMWLGDNTAGGPVWIQYEFDDVYKLYEMWVWNYNTALEPLVHFGIKEVTIEYSTDGTSWTQLGFTHQFAQAPGTGSYAHNTTIPLDGVLAKYVRITAKSNWGTLSQYGLSEVRFYQKPVQAREPSPANEATGVSLEDMILSWRPGREAASHAVYFSTDRQAVVDGTAPVSISTEHDFDPGPLNFGTTYFWRVDEVNEAGSPAAYPGDPWSFTTQEYSMVDDFEGYTNDSPNRVFQAWIDGWGFSKDEFFPEGNAGNGTGALVGYDPAAGNIMETAIVHGGGKSMPVEYNNVNSPFYSEIERTWDTPQDWTVGGATTLTLYVRGNPVGFLQRTDGSIVMGGGGADIWGTADQFRFAYKELNGDGSITARVDSLVQADPWTKVGVMIRETLDAGSKHAAVVVTPGNGVSFVRRPTMNAASEQVNQTALQAPYWVRLTRKGNTFTAQRSADGNTWMSITTDPASVVDITMTPNVFVGLAVTSHNTSMQTSAEFSSVTATGSVTGQWQNAEIGVAQPSNDPAPLYVAVEDKAGHKKLIVHPSEEAATTVAWQPWQIPFSEFTAAGVNLTAVKKMYIGAGDRTNPTPGGAGLLFIDDIGVGKPSGN
jgi:regulation of enolase protein 1 (concanavalin A-like superfamily)